MKLRDPDINPNLEISEKKAGGAFDKRTARSAELNDELGLNLYDFGAGNNDARLEDG